MSVYQRLSNNIIGPNGSACTDLGEDMDDARCLWGWGWGGEEITKLINTELKLILQHRNAVSVHCYFCCGVSM